MQQEDRKVEEVFLVDDIEDAALTNLSDRKASAPAAVEVPP
jgi:hypothetical protein